MAANRIRTRLHCVCVFSSQMVRSVPIKSRSHLAFSWRQRVYGFNYAQ